MKDWDDTSAVRMYATRPAAERGKLYLEASGIPSFIRADDCGGWRPYMTSVTGVRLVVRNQDLQAAEDILRVSEPVSPEAEEHTAEP